MISSSACIGILTVVCTVALGQTHGLSQHQRTGISRAPASTRSTKIEKNQLVQQVIESLDIPKAVDSSLESSGTFLKAVPVEKDPVMQKKITDLYLAAQKEFEGRKAQERIQVLDEIKKQFMSRFSDEELKYLIVLSKYPVYKRLQAFLASEAYSDILGKPFVKNREVLTNLKKQVKEIKSAATPVQKN